MKKQDTGGHGESQGQVPLTRRNDIIYNKVECPLFNDWPTRLEQI